MAKQEVEIYFKVEGLDGYITDLNDLKGALGQVEGATQDVTDATKKMEDTVEQDFSKLESRLETAEGAVKVLAGSFEILAGAAGLLGVEDNEFFKELEDNVVGVIALAEGAINVSEGLKLLAQNQKLATIAQKAFNLAAKANPYVLLAAGLVTLAGAIAAYVTFVKDEAVPTEEELAAMREKNQRAVEAAKKAEEAAKQAEQNRVDTLEELRSKLDEVSTSEEAKNKTTLDGAIATNEALLAEQETALSNIDILISAQELRTGASRESLQALVDQGLNLTDQEQQLFDLYTRRDEKEGQLNETTNLLNEAYKERNRLLQEQNLIETDRPEKIDEVTNAFDRQRQILPELNRLTKELVGHTNNLKLAQVNVADGAEETADTWAMSYKKAFDSAVEDPEKLAELLKRDTQAALTFASNLNEIFTKDNEKRAERNFKIQKALSLSTAVINTAQGITQALTDYTQPSTILRILQTAAVAAAGAAQIATISRQKFSPNGGGGPDTISTPNPGASINYNFGQQAGATIQPGQLSTGEQPAPQQVYVLASDVTNAQQAQQQINNLAKL